jgi:hypothetical protein
MFKNISITVFIFSALLFTSCGKQDNTEPVPDYPTFANYTSTDIQGQIISAADSDDWRKNDLWVGNVASLISYSNNYVPCDADTQSIVYPAYPNPTNGIVNLSFDIEPTTAVTYRIVNQTFNVIASGDTIKSTSNNLTIPVDLTAQVTANELVRVYYAIIKNNSCAYRGHGDIKIN